MITADDTERYGIILSFSCNAILNRKKHEGVSDEIYVHIIYTTPKPTQ
jgi:hypothetical protein